MKRVAFGEPVFLPQPKQFLGFALLASKRDPALFLFPVTIAAGVI
jgi:membrane protein YqaA with SNARE-associated domain